MTYDVFISYSRKDTAIADRVCAAFDAAGISYFIDRQGIAGGMEFPVVLAEAIENSRLFLFMASENSYQSKFTNNEVLYAFNEKPHNSLLPYIIDGSRMPPSLRFTFASINVRNITEHPIDPVLVDDVLRLLGHTRKATNLIPRQYSQQELEELKRKGDEYYDAKQYMQASECYRHAANHGYSYAQYKLGMMYLDGKGVAHSVSEGMKLILKAAESGYVRAQNLLGIIYKGHLYVKCDEEKALYWRSKAAENGDPDAQLNLGNMYLTGDCVKKNKKMARYWFQRAANQGSIVAKNKLQNL